MSIQPVMKMNIAVLSIFPRMFDALLAHGIAAQAVQKGALTVDTINPRDFTIDKHRAVDDRPFGGGAGMLMKPEPLARAIDSAKRAADRPVIYLSPQGETLSQSTLRELSLLPGAILLAGRYRGIDERIIESRVDREISLGDYILAGGELAAMVLIEGVARLLPGVLGNQQSTVDESFTDSLLDAPQYTRPEVFEGRAAPAVLLSGDHAQIRQWRRQQSMRRTFERRPDLLEALRVESCKNR